MCASKKEKKYLKNLKKYYQQNGFYSYFWKDLTDTNKTDFKNRCRSLVAYVDCHIYGYLTINVALKHYKKFLEEFQILSYHFKVYDKHFEISSRKFQLKWWILLSKNLTKVM